MSWNKGGKPFMRQVCLGLLVCAVCLPCTAQDDEGGERKRQFDDSCYSQNQVGTPDSDTDLRTHIEHAQNEAACIANARFCENEPVKSTRVFPPAVEDSDADTALPLCGLFEHNEGAWVLAGKQPAPPCCGWDRHKWGGPAGTAYMYMDDVEHCGDFEMPLEPYPACQLPPCEREMAFKGRTDYLVHSGGYGCSCKRFGFEDLYKWVPHECRLIEWDAKDFCRVLGNRTLLVLGDSTVSQSASVLMNYIHFGFWEYPTLGCQSQVKFAISDTLVGVSLGVDNRGAEWKYLVRHYRPDIVLLSTGPHVRGTSAFTALVSQISHEHLTLFPNLMLIWKTQAPGGCTENISETYPKKGRYNWGDFEEWDWISRRTFTGQRNQYVLDLNPLYYRTDAHPGSHYYEGYRVDSRDIHPRTPVRLAPLRETQTQDRNRDCLHHCIPGPIGLLPQLLLHLMHVENI